MGFPFFEINLSKVKPLPLLAAKTKKENIVYMDKPIYYLPYQA